MLGVWIGVGVAIGISVVSLWLTLQDRRAYRRMEVAFTAMIGSLRREIDGLRDRIRQWEGWGRLVCAIAADAQLQIPDPPPNIDEPVAD